MRAERSRSENQSVPAGLGACGVRAGWQARVTASSPPASIVLFPPSLDFNRRCCRSPSTCSPKDRCDSSMYTRRVRGYTSRTVFSHRGCTSCSHTRYYVPAAWCCWRAEWGAGGDQVIDQQRYELAAAVFLAIPDNAYTRVRTLCRVCRPLAVARGGASLLRVSNHRVGGRIESGQTVVRQTRGARQRRTARADRNSPRKTGPALKHWLLTQAGIGAPQ